VGFIVDIVELKQGILKYFSFPLSVAILLLHYSNSCTEVPLKAEITLRVFFHHKN
jgi:hypothetical protein